MYKLKTGFCATCGQGLLADAGTKCVKCKRIAELEEENVRLQAEVDPLQKYFDINESFTTCESAEIDQIIDNFSDDGTPKGLSKWRFKTIYESARKIRTDFDEMSEKLAQVDWSLPMQRRDELATLRKRCEELEKYAAHFPTCNVRLTNFDPVKAVCDCGLDQLLQKGLDHDAVD